MINNGSYKQNLSICEFKARKKDIFIIIYGYVTNSQSDQRLVH